MNKIEELLVEFEAMTSHLKEVASRWKKLQKEYQNNYRLTVKEQEIYEYFVAGLNLDEISKKLGISIKTSTTHRDRIRKKMGFKSAKEFYTFLREKH